MAINYNYSEIDVIQELGRKCGRCGYGGIHALSVRTKWGDPKPKGMSYKMFFAEAFDSPKVTFPQFALWCKNCLSDKKAKAKKERE